MISDPALGEEAAGGDEIWQQVMRLLKIVILIALLLFAAGLGSYYYFMRDLPSLKTLEDYHPNLVSEVYSKDGRIIGEFYVERRVIVPVNRMPKHLINAFLAAEDSKFFEHEGINYTSIFRALYKDLMAGKIVQGGSTITQQVAKSFFLSPERKISRKIREAIMAFRIEKNLTKDEILNLYLNQIYFGNGSYGVQTAAETYFGKNVGELDIAESALLAGLPKGPSKYNPYSNFELSKKRQKFIIGRMLEEKFISPGDAEMAIKEKLKLRPRKVDSLWVGPYFTENVRKYIEEKYGDDILYRGGLKIYTTMDVEMQKAANTAVREGLREYGMRKGYRGPLATLRSRADVTTFLSDEDRRIPKHLEQDVSYRGVITSIDYRDMSLNVAVGSHRGIISSSDLAWAKLYNPTNSPDGGKYADLRHVFHEGDVIDVMVKDRPYNDSLPAPLSLVQPSLAQAALFAIEPETGYVRAMVGGSDFSKSQFNRATQSLRQPGSAFKPIIYAAAMDKNYTPATIVLDSPLVFNEVLNEGDWRPRNYDEKFLGPTTVRTALARSRNVVTIKILKDIGIDYAISYARLLGLTSPLTRDLSLGLGSSAVSLMELTTAYATFDNLGNRPQPIIITRIIDKDGNVLEDNAPSITPVLNPATAYVMTSLLQSVIEKGTGVKAKALGRPAAGKTGTTNEMNDAWFIGYVPGLAAGAWVGYDEQKQLGKGETGAMAALPIWLKFMKEATAGTPVRNFQVPEGVEFAKIDPDTGLLANSTTEDPLFEVFKAGTAPTGKAAAKEKAHSANFFMIDTGSKPRTRRPDEQPAD